MHATVIVGSNNLFREGLISILGAANFRILDAIASVNSSVLDTLAEERDGILFILEAGDDSAAMLDQIKLIKAHNPMWRVVVLDSTNQLTNAASVYRGGASAYFANVASSVAFIKFLELVMLGETILPAEFLPFVLDHENCDENGRSHHDDGGACKTDLKQEFLTVADSAPMRQLSAREKVILRCIIDGCSNKEIARKIAISEATVKVHVKSILRKIRVHSRTQAAIWGMSYGLSIWQVGNGSTPLAQISVQPSVSQHAMPALPPAKRSESSLFTAAALRKSEPW